MLVGDLTQTWFDFTDKSALIRPAPSYIMERIIALCAEVTGENLAVVGEITNLHKVNNTARSCSSKSYIESFVRPGNTSE